MKERLDKILVSRGLVKSREMAKSFIFEGKVFVNGEKITKAGTLIDETSDVNLEEKGLPYVSRGGLKLEAALNFFKIQVNNKITMDVGSSTGGFTDCMLKFGARKVYCIDVGYGQLAWSLRQDPRVILLERTNIRLLDKIDWNKKTKRKEKEFEDLMKRNIDIATIDVSFISLKKVFPVVITYLKDKGDILALVKPQFEVGKGQVDRGGVIKDEEKRLKAVNSVKEDAEKAGLKTIEFFRCPIPGQKGNVEYFLYLKKE